MTKNKINGLVKFIAVGFISTAMILSFLPINKRGIALTYCYPEDYTRLKVSWYYVWGETGCGWGDFIPMIYDGIAQGNIPTSHTGWILMFNEPNNFPPYGATVSPTEAVRRYLVLKEQYPYAKFAVGGTSIFANWWIDEFDDLVPKDKRPERYHIHAYLEAWINLNYIKAIVEENKNMGRILWITELASTTGDAVKFKELLDYIENEPAIERYAVFTNRATGIEPWYPYGWKVQLVNQDGNLTELREVYKNLIDYKFNIFFPLIINNN